MNDTPKILIVDDHILNRELLAAIKKKQGYHHALITETSYN